MRSAPLAAEDVALLLAPGDVWADLRGARIFITGGTGFVGTWLLEAFVAANRRYALGAEAVVLSRDPGRFAAGLPHLAAAPGISFVAGDMTAFALPAGPFTHAIHAATERSYRPDAQRPLGILGDDERATRRVLDLCTAARVRKLLFVSSGAAYGKQPAHCERLAEADAFAPDTADVAAVYGHSKRLSECTCFLYGAARGIEVTVARLFAFVGPHLPLDEGYAVGDFIRDALAGDPIRIGGDGTPLRSYLYAADLAVWLWTMLVRGAPGRIYNVGAAEPIAIAALARAVADAAGRNTRIDIAQAVRPGAAPARYLPSTQRAQTELGLRAAVDLREGLRRTLAWHAATRGVKTLHAEQPYHDGHSHSAR